MVYELKAMSEPSDPTIGPYESLPVACRAYDPHAAEIARLMARWIREHIAWAEVEHVGSTSVAGCGGEGIVDLLILAPPARCAEAEQALEPMGFQPIDRGGDAPVRPVRGASATHHGQMFQLHLYVLAADAPEAERMQFFRTCLRSDPDLLKAYVACKRKILAGGAVSPNAYDCAKGQFIGEVLA